MTRYGVDETRMRIQGLLGREKNPDADGILQLAGALADKHEELHAEVQVSNVVAGLYLEMLEAVGKAIPAEAWCGSRQESIAGMAARIQQLQDRCADLEAERDLLRRVTQLQADNTSFIISLLDTEDVLE